MTIELRGIWRGKMNINFYEPFPFRYQYPPEYAGPPANYDPEPSLWFGLKISSQFEQVPGIMVISGEAGHYSGKYGDQGVVTLPVTGFFSDDAFQEVHLTFFRLPGVKPANFLGSLDDSSHIVGDWTEARQWNQWSNYGMGYDTFLFGKMSLQKIISFKDSVELATARHLFSP